MGRPTPEKGDCVTSKQRVISALKHEEPDRVPVGELAIDGPVIEQILGRPSLMRAKFRETLALWEGRRDEVVECYKRDTTELVRALGFDIVVCQLVPSKNSTPRPMKKIDDEIYEDENGVIYKLSATTGNLLPYARKRSVPEVREEDLVYTEPERPDDSAFEFIRYIVEEFGESHFIAVRVADVGLPKIGWGEDAFINFLEKPELCRKKAELQGRRALDSLKWFAGEEVDAVFPGADYAHNLGPFLSPELFREWIFPWLMAFCEEAHKLGLFVIKHACGNNWKLMDMFCEAGYDAYQAIQGSASMDLKLLKEKYGSRITLWGGVQVENLVRGSKEDCLRDAEYALRYAGPGGGFIFGSSHSVPVGARVENYLSAVEFVKKHGTYPLSLN